MTDLVKRQGEEYWVCFTQDEDGVRDFHFDDSKDILNWIEYVQFTEFSKLAWRELSKIINNNKQ